jgi:protein SHQ1
MESPVTTPFVRMSIFLGIGLIARANMPLTPYYNLSEVDQVVIVSIQCPHVDLGSSDIDCEQGLFTFRNGCYRLSLQFPFEFDVDDEERYKATRVKRQGHDRHPTLKAHLPKKTRGARGGIELLCAGLNETTINSLVHINGAQLQALKSAPLIQEISSSDTAAVGVSPTGEEEGSSDSDSDSDSDSEESDDDNDKNHYGFKNRYCDLLTPPFLEENPDVFETFENLDEMDSVKRRVMRVTEEDDRFDHLRYMGDMYGILEDDVYTEAVTFVPFWCVEWNKWKERQVSTGGGGETVLLFETETTAVAAGGAGTGAGVVAAEQALCLEKDEEQMLYVLVDILFGYCFDVRCTAGEVTVESAANITKLSSSLSWFEQYEQDGDDMDTVLANCIRRGVCYPYLRNWSLIRLVLDDLGKMLTVGRSCILLAVQAIKKVFDKADNHSVLNTLFMNDFLAWVPSLGDRVFEVLAYSYQMALQRVDGLDPASGGVVPFRDSKVGFPLAQLEAVVEMSMARQMAGHDAMMDGDDDSAAAAVAAAAAVPLDYPIALVTEPRKAMQVTSLPLSEIL